MKLDRRRKYYMVLDCETATLPFAQNFEGEIKKKIAIAKPLIYDFAWQIIDNKGRVYVKRSFLITEIFSVPSVFNTAYYASKRPIYLERLAKGEISLMSWIEASKIFEEDLHLVEAVGAYNSMFDFKKAIPFTELYISKLYSPDFYDWEAMQNNICRGIAAGEKWGSKEFDPDNFKYRGNVYPLFDLWGLSATHILNCDEYREQAIRNRWVTASKKYFSTTAENCYRFINQDYDFEEAHTALEDAEIESEIFALIHKVTKGKWEMGIIYFPFRILGRIM